MVVVVTYKNGTKEELNNYTIVNGTNLNIEQTSVEIRYGDMTATQPINVEEKAIVSIEVSKRPDKIKYIQNKEQLNTAGGIIKVNYNNGTSENISMDNENVTITGFSNENLGNVNITVTYKTKVTQFEIEIIQDENVNPGEEEPEDPDKGDTDQGDPDQGNTGNEDPDQGDTDKGDPDNKVYAKSSDLKNAKCDVKAIKIHMPENETSNYYAIIDVEVNNISINYENDSYKYYYYISPNQGEGDKIQNWIEIDKINNKNNLLVFSINTDDVKNYKELLDLNSIYLYVKEVVKKGGDQSVAISCEMLMDSDDSKIEINGNNNNANNSNTNQGNKNPSNNGDKTIATNKLPYTGLKMTLLISVVIIGLCGIVLYIRYKNLNKYVK